MCYCDACKKSINPSIIRNTEGKCIGFDYLCSDCKRIGMWVDTEESIQKEWRTIKTYDEMYNIQDKITPDWGEIEDF